MVRALLLFGATLLAASISYAQNSTPTDQTEQVRLLLERIQHAPDAVIDREQRLHVLPIEHCYVGLAAHRNVDPVP